MIISRRGILVRRAYYVAMCARLHRSVSVVAKTMADKSFQRIALGAANTGSGSC